MTDLSPARKVIRAMAVAKGNKRPSVKQSAFVHETYGPATRVFCVMPDGSELSVTVVDVVDVTE